MSIRQIVITGLFVSAVSLLFPAYVSAQVATASLDTKSKEVAYGVKESPDIIKHWNSGGFYSSGKKLYNAKNKKMCKVGGKIVDFAISPGLSSDNYAVLYSTKDENKLFIGDLWKLKRRVAKIKEVKNPSAICYSKSGSMLIVAGADNRIYSYNTKHFKPLWAPIDIGFVAKHVAVSSDASKMAFASDKGITVYDVFQKKFMVPITLSSNIKRMEFTGDGTKLVALTDNKHIMCYDVINSMVMSEIIALGDATDFALSPQGSYAAVVTGGGRISQIDLNNPYANRSYYDVGSDIRSIALIADGEEVKFIAYGTPTSLNYIPFTGKALADHSAEDLVIEAIPYFSDYRRDYIGTELATWGRRGEFERYDDFELRVNEKTIYAKGQEFNGKAEREYIDKYSLGNNMAAATSMEIKTYDSTAGTFTIASNYGDITISVPRGNREADDFREDWQGVEVRDVEYAINNDKLIIKNVTFVTPKGKSYSYMYEGTIAYNQDASIHESGYYVSLYAKYTEPAAAKQSEELSPATKKDGAAWPSNNRVDNGSLLAMAESVVEEEKIVSDVDINIPQADLVNDNTIVVIIANQTYRYVDDVPMAINDGEVFAKYCEQTLGIPKQFIDFVPDATYMTMSRAVKDAKKTRAHIDKEEMTLIFYYAGHGYRDDRNGEPYLVPVDVDPKSIEDCYKQADLYENLGNAGYSNVIVFLDSCFSGSTRNQNQLVPGRGIDMDPIDVLPVDNMVVFAATSEAQTALPYEEQNHGMFTYFLLKKLQESKGNVTLGELDEYILKKVSYESFFQNNKEQTPQVLVPNTMGEDAWRDIKLTNNNERDEDEVAM